MGRVLALPPCRVTVREMPALGVQHWTFTHLIYGRWDENKGRWKPLALQVLYHVVAQGVHAGARLGPAAHSKLSKMGVST